MRFRNRQLPLAAALLAGCMGVAGCAGLGQTTTPKPVVKHAAVKHAATTATPTAAAGTAGNYGVGPLDLPAGEGFSGRFFAASSPWNTTVGYAAVDPHSGQLLHAAQMRVGVIEQPGNLPPKIQRRLINAGVFINTTAWTDPVVKGGPETVMHCRQIHCGDDTGVTQLPVPANVSPDPRYDGWFTIISPDGQFAYDLWRARRLPDGSISFQYMRKWALAGRGYGQPMQVSARGSGLPLFAGLIRPQELAAGEIDHALAISVPAPAARYYVTPASVTDGNGTTGSLPEGARIRLKATAHLTPVINPVTHRAYRLSRSQQRVADALMWTLHTYGAIVIGRAAVPTLYAQRDVTTSMLLGNELQSLHLSDFEVMALPALQQDPPASTQQTGPTFAPGPGYGG